MTDIGGQLDLALAAELAGVDVDTVYQYNPGYNRWSTDPTGPHSLVMPIDVANNLGRTRPSACRRPRALAATQSDQRRGNLANR